MAKDVRAIAQEMCRLETGDCVMDERPKRPVCTVKNCEMVRRALDMVRHQKQLESE